MEITIRKANFEDREALCDIHVASIRGLGGSHYSEAEVDVWSRGRNPARYDGHLSERHVIIAQDKASPVGFGTIDLKTGEVYQLYIRPDYARRGIGRMLLDEMIGKAREAGLLEVSCISSLNARDFYIQAGFEPGKKRKHRFRNGGEVDCIPMKRSLE